MEQYIKLFLRSIITGTVISLAGTVYLSVNEKIIGAILFSYALMIVVKLSMPLFTGRIGFLGRENYKSIATILIGNFCGILGMVEMLKYTRNYQAIHSKASELVAAKYADNNVSLLILSILCGMVMYLAVVSYNKSKSDVLIILSIVLFILSSFEHCIANFFFITLAGNLEWTKLGIMILGNAIGSIVLHQTLKYSLTD